MFLGRPASISPAELDTKFPAPDSLSTDENGTVQKDCMGFNFCSDSRYAKPVGVSCNLSVCDGEGCCVAVT